mmetsp:Transcript_20896/g.64780  ORF Transcript_20896/g.64780 Transcript_20896/m.64780 type:complete len:239 (+) Transcript_20896:408-1124(+)
MAGSGSHARRTAARGCTPMSACRCGAAARCQHSHRSPRLWLPGGSSLRQRSPRGPRERGGWSRGWIGRRLAARPAMRRVFWRAPPPSRCGRCWRSHRSDSERSFSEPGPRRGGHPQSLSMMYINPTPADYDRRLLLEASDEARPLLLLAFHFLFFVCTSKYSQRRRRQQRPALPELGVVPPPLGSTWGITDSGASRPPHPSSLRSAQSYETYAQDTTVGAPPTVTGKAPPRQQVLYKE